MLNLDTMVPQIKDMYDGPGLPLTDLVLKRDKFETNYKDLIRIID